MVTDLKHFSLCSANHPLRTFFLKRKNVCNEKKCSDCLLINCLLINQLMILDFSQNGDFFLRCLSIVNSVYLLDKVQ